MVLPNLPFLGAPSGGDLAENTLYSATDLFMLYKQLLKQTLQLNRGKGLLGLVGLLQKYLREYTEKVLLAAIPGLTTTSGSSGLAKPFSLSSLASLGKFVLDSFNYSSRSLFVCMCLSSMTG